MRYRQLGKTGLWVSVIGFGGIPIQRVDDQTAMQLVNRALNLGINFFDTARGYTDSEAKLGLVLRERQQEAIIATKSMARTREEMARDIEKSLRALGTEYIDLYQVHNVQHPSELEQVLKPGGAIEALLEAKKSGIIKHIGITSHIKELFKDALKTGFFETIQLPFNPIESDGIPEILDLAAAHGAGVIIMKPLAGGSIKNAALALKYILEYPVSTIIPGMDSLQQVEENASIGSWSDNLTPAEREMLNREIKEIGITFCRRCGYCRPCPQGIDIPLVFLLDGYYTRYGLTEWAKERYRGMKVQPDACTECKECEDKCPYNLPIHRMLVEARARLQ
ncbi:MAG: aldo/keto reductase [Syntrophomonadaceae bacterium]|nr:aldo/keto reductase [Syntrophomonadaceae bacterium]